MRAMLPERDSYGYAFFERDASNAGDQTMVAHAANLPETPLARFALLYPA